MACVTTKGQTFSSDAVARDVYFRTDTDMQQWYTYDGTRWLSAPQTQMTAYTSFSTDGSGGYGGMGSRFALYVDYVNLITQTATTCDTDNYWTLTIYSVAADASETQIYQITTADDVAGDWTGHSADPSEHVPANYFWYKYTAAATGSPGTLAFRLGIVSRHIQT